MFVSHHPRGLALFVNESLAEMHDATELSMGSTYGTNNVGAELSAVMGKLDGTGTPLAYLFKTRSIPRSEGRTERQEEGSMIELLSLFLTELQSYGFNPTFFGTDKDASEIAAVNLVFPQASHQLCLWHGKRALWQKLAETTKSKPQISYRPAEV